MMSLQPGKSEDGDGAGTQLLVDISDALSEREKVKFTVHTKVRANRDCLTI